MKNDKRTFNLEERMIDFAVSILEIAEDLPKTLVGRHIAGQLLRSGTSPAPNYAEATSAESRKDFIHKLKIALKELRETRVWLRILERKKLVEDSIICKLLNECEELIRILASSVNTAEKNISGN